MDETYVDAVTKFVSAHGRPVSSPEIADAVGLPFEEVDAVLWNRPDLFAWQPGHRWCIYTGKQAVGPPETDEHPAAVSGSFRPTHETSLQAVTLESGTRLTIKKSRLDTPASFSVRTLGKDIELVLNVDHPVFDRLPLPFADPEDSDHSYRRLVEVMLEAWAIYEDGLVADTDRRAARDVRQGWGQALADAL
jgi:hypothetical protein